MKPRPVRFAPDALDFALIAVSFPGEPFTPDTVALIYDEAPLNGCALVLRDDARLEEGSRCTVKVGRMDPLDARVVWKKQIEKGLIHLGFQYLE